MNYVTDTHPLVWSLFAPRRLSTRVATLFAEANSGTHTILIPAVVVAEAIMVVERRRVAGTVAELLQGLALMEASGNYQLLDLIPATVIASHTFTALPDIFDRLIVAEARRLGLALLSRDETIAGSGLVTTLWA